MAQEPVTDTGAAAAAQCLVRLFQQVLGSFNPDTHVRSPCMLQILEGYLLLGAGAQLTPYGDVISQSLTASVASVSRAVLASCAPQPAAPAGPGGAAAQRQAQQQAAQQLASETSQEGLGAAALSDVMLQLFPADGPALLAPALREMAGLIASDVVPMQVGVGTRACCCLCGTTCNAVQVATEYIQRAQRVQAHLVHHQAEMPNMTLMPPGLWWL